MSRKYRGLTGDMWNVYGVMSGETAAGRMESRFQVLSRRLDGRNQFFLIDRPEISFCAFRIG